MRQRTAIAGQRRSRAIPSLGATLVVLVVVAANWWWFLSADPEPQPLGQIERLQAMQDQAVEAEHYAVERQARSAVAAAAPAPKTVAAQVSAAEVNEEPARPVPVPVSRSTVIGSGESLEVALGRLFIYGEAAREVVTAYRSVRNPRLLRAGERLWAQFESASPMDPHALMQLVVAPGRSGEGVTLTRKGHDGELSFDAREGGLPGSLSRQALRCGISGSLTASLTRCGHGAGLAHLIAPVLEGRLDLSRDLRPGDELRVVYDELVAGEEHVRYETVLAVAWKGAIDSFTALRFAHEGNSVGWFDPAGRSIEPMFLRRPVRDGHMSSPFSLARMHPVLHKLMPHLGVDYAAPTGTPVLAIADGRVLTRGRGPVAGKVVRVQHGRNYRSEYLHLSRFARGLKPGSRVTKGQVVGFVGSTGRSTGPHLHLAVKKAGRHIDPLEVVALEGTPVAPRDRKAFEQQAEDVLRLLEALDSSKTNADAS